MQGCQGLQKQPLSIRVSIRKTFAEGIAKFFFAHQFCAKKQQFAQSFAEDISRKIALFRFCETQVFAQFRNFVKIKRLVCFLEFNSGKTCFGMSSFWSLLHNFDHDS